MIIGGLQKFSLIDYPGKISAIIFTMGCNFRCAYCHNPELVIPARYTTEISFSEVFDFLDSRRGKLEAVCITGGEPTQHSGLLEMIKKIKNMGFLVKLDSNGSRPELLKELLDKKMIDYVAMDIKAPFEKYSKITGCHVFVEKIKRSIDIIMSSSIEYEFRTTIVKSLTSKDDLRKIAKTISGADNYYLQKFISTKLVNSNLSKEVSYSENELEELAIELKKYVKNCNVR